MTQGKNKLVLHHVGGRAGSICFPVAKAFEADIINILYDADEGCVEQIRNVWRSRKCQTHVYSYCLSDQAGKDRFYLNYDPNTSSIYKLNEKYKDFYSPHKNFGMDYVLGDGLKTMETLELDTTTLDAVVREGSVPPPDFLSIDTQGSELGILKGAQRCLQENVLGVYAEVEFQPIYQDQPLFGELCRYLNELGFVLADVHFSRRHPIRGKEGFRGEGLVTEGEALFLKMPDALDRFSDTDRPLKLNKLAFMALMFNKFELAQLCLESPAFRPMASEGGYLELMAKLQGALRELPQRRRPVFSDMYTFEQSQARFNNGKGASKDGKNGFRRQDNLLSKAARKMRTAARTAVKAFKASWGKCYCWLYFRLKISRTEIEKILLAYDLKTQYELVVRNRIQDFINQGR